MAEIEVALVGRNEDLRLAPEVAVTDAWWDAFLEGENERRWDDRPRASLAVSDDQKLGEIFDRAIADLGAFDADWSKWEPDWSDPTNPPEDPGRRTMRLMALRADDSPRPLLDRMSREITIVDDRGLGC